MTGRSAAALELMRRHRHRFSKDIDIFINDPQFLGYLTPRLSPTADSLTTKYIEDNNYVKLVFSEARGCRSSPHCGASRYTDITDERQL
jgi:hypothetical protein